MVIVGSVRPGRKGIAVAEWARTEVEDDGHFELDFVDLLELGLPFMDEPQHPSKRMYSKAHTFAWSERVDAADAFIFVTPEYNHSYAPAIKNAIDFLFHEWWRKPWMSVAYGGESSGTRGAMALTPVVSQMGMVRTLSSVEIHQIRDRVVDGRFEPTDRERAKFDAGLDELKSLAPLLARFRADNP